MAEMKLYMTPGSCSTGIHIILEELEEAFEAYIVNLPAGDQFKPDYVAINAKSTIPTLVRRDGSSLTEVPAIVYWLGRSHPRAALWPDDIEKSCRLIEAMAYIVGTIHGQGFARIFATIRLREIPSITTRCANSAATSLPRALPSSARRLERKSIWQMPIRSPTPCCSMSSSGPTRPA